MIARSEDGIVRGRGTGAWDARHGDQEALRSGRALVLLYSIVAVSKWLPLGDGHR